MAKAKRLVDDAPEDTVFLSLCCDGNLMSDGKLSHVQRRWRIATFHISADPDFALPDWPDGTPRWTELRNEYISMDRTVSRLDTGSTRTALVNDRPVTTAERKANPAIFEAGSRSRYKLQCRTCGISREFRDAGFDRLLTQIHALVGSREFPLSSLPAKLPSA